MSVKLEGDFFHDVASSPLTTSEYSSLYGLSISEGCFWTCLSPATRCSYLKQQTDPPDGPPVMHVVRTFFPAALGGFTDDERKAERGHTASSRHTDSE